MQLGLFAVGLLVSYLGLSSSTILVSLSATRTSEAGGGIVHTGSGRSEVVLIDMYGVYFKYYIYF